MGSRIGIGFIGAGEVSVMHARGLRDLPQCELVGLWNRTVETGRRRAQEESCRLYASAEELVADPKIQAVLILTNLETHLRYATMAMDAGKHVLVEKPICANVPEIREMIGCQRRNRVVCMPGHNYIHEDSLARARQMIVRGELGRIVSCYVLYNIHHSEERASTLPGVVRQILTHNLYTMMYLVGRPRRVSGFKANRHYEKIDKEDVALVNIELAGGGLAHLCASFAADDLSSAPWSVYVKVIGTAGTTQYSYNDWVCAGRGLSHSRTFTAYQETLTRELRCFVDDCIGRGSEPPSTLEDAMWAQQALEAIELSIASGAAVEVG